MSIGTASDLPRLLACAGSAALPQARTSSTWTEQGNARHAAREAAANEGRYEDLPAPVRRILDGGLMTVLAEVAIAVDVDTGKARKLGAGIGRSYGQLGPSEVAGTADLVAYDDERLVVVDYKGHGKSDAFGQVAFHALGWAQLLGRNSAEVMVVPEVGAVDHRHLDGIELDAFGVALADLVARVARERAKVAAGGVPDVAEGSHCRYCPASDHCPAKVALLKRMLRGDELTTVEMMAPLDPATAPKAYEMLRAMEAMTKRVRAHVMAYAQERPIRLDGGRVFGPHSKLGNEQLDGDVVYEVVRRRNGQAIADLAVERVATKKKLKDALAFAGEKVAPAERAILEEVRQLGGATRERKVVVEEYEEREALDEGAA